MNQILIVEDDKHLNDGIRLALKKDFVCSQAYNIASAREMYHQQQYDLVLLDINLPDGDGIDFLTEIRKTDDIPVIMLTANNMEMDIVSALELGADDYITKPFNVQILVQRVRAVLNRYRAGNEKKERIKAGNLEIDFQSWQVWKNGDELTLTPTEFKLLKKFCDNPGIVLTRAVLLEALWDKEENYVDEHTLTIFISRLRSKIADRDHAYIRTIYGTGYQWTGE